MLLCGVLSARGRPLQLLLWLFVFTELLLFWPGNCSSPPHSNPRNHHDIDSSSGREYSTTRATIHNPTYATESVDASNSGDERVLLLPATDGSLSTECTPPPAYSLTDPMSGPSSAQRDAMEPITTQPLSQGPQTDASISGSLNASANARDKPRANTYEPMEVYSPTTISHDNDQALRSSFHECLACFCDTLGL